MQAQAAMAIHGERPARRERRKNRSMFKDTRGRWWLDYYTPEGKRRRKLCGSFDDAKSELAKIVVSKKNHTYIDPRNAPLFTDYADKYLETISAKKKSHESEQRLMKNLTEFFGGVRVSQITRSRVMEYRKERAKRVKGSTVNREMALLRHVFNVALDEGFLAVNPARSGPSLKAFKEQRRMRYLDMDEISKLLAAIEARIVKNSTDKLKANAGKFWKYLHTAAVIALHTGMRKGEILSLKWEQVNWEKQHILLTDTKNGEPRRVPIDSGLLKTLLAHRALITRQNEKRERKNEDLVFPSYDRDGNVVSLADVKVGFGRVLADAGIKDFRFHDLRHTFASHYMMSGGNLYTLAKILGHKDFKMTQRYADLSPDFIDRERERMDTIWTPPANPASNSEGKEAPKYVQ